MEIGNAVTSPVDWVDRIAARLGRSYAAASIAPHALTVRWSYTVPAGRRAMVTLGTLGIMRSAVAAPHGAAIASIRYTPNGGAAQFLLQCVLHTNVVDVQSHADNGGIIFLSEGDLMEFLTQDTSTGGALTFFGSTFIAEFTP